jgi:hypothetical protein
MWVIPAKTQRQYKDLMSGETVAPLGRIRCRLIEKRRVRRIGEIPRSVILEAIELSSQRQATKNNPIIFGKPLLFSQIIPYNIYVVKK